MEAEPGQQGQRDGELIGQGPDHHHGQQRRAQLRGGPDVAQPIAQLAARPSQRGMGNQLSGAHEGQAGDHRQVGGGIDQEAGGQAHRRDQRSRHRRPHDSGRVHHHAVEADGIGQVGRPDHLQHEGLASRRVDHPHTAHEPSQQVDQPQFDVPEGGEQTQGQGQHAGARLGPEQQPTLVDAVGHHPTPGPGHQHGHELHGRDRPQVHAATGETQDQPGQADALHPGATHRDDLSEEVQPIVAHPQGPERPTGHHGWSARAGPGGPAARRGRDRQFRHFRNNTVRGPHPPPTRTAPQGQLTLRRPISAAAPS